MNTAASVSGTSEHGIVRVVGSRVTLESIVAVFDRGATPEEVLQSFPSLALTDVYAILAWLVSHRPEVDSYLERRVAEEAASSKRSVNVRRSAIFGSGCSPAGPVARHDPDCSLRAGDPRRADAGRRRGPIARPIAGRSGSRLRSERRMGARARFGAGAAQRAGAYIFSTSNSRCRRMVSTPSGGLQDPCPENTCPNSYADNAARDCF